MLRTLSLTFILPLLLAFSSVTHAKQIDVDFVDLDGNPVKLSDYRGKWVVVNLWATWCPPCRAEMPELSFFHDKRSKEDAIVLGVDYENISVDKVKAFADEMMVSFPIVRLPGKVDGKTTPFGPLKGLPTTYMVSPEGELVAARVGMVDQKMLNAFIDKMNARAAKESAEKEK